MVNLKDKIVTFAFGTHEENLRNGVEGNGWMAAQYLEPLLGGAIAYVGEIYNINSLKVAGSILAIDSLFRVGSALYKFGNSKLTHSDLDHSGVPTSGIIGTLRDATKFTKEY